MNRDEKAGNFYNRALGLRKDRVLNDTGVNKSGLNDRGGQMNRDEKAGHFFNRALGLPKDSGLNETGLNKSGLNDRGVK